MICEAGSRRKLRNATLLINFSYSALRGWLFYHQPLHTLISDYYSLKLEENNTTYHTEFIVVFLPFKKVESVLDFNFKLSLILRPTLVKKVAQDHHSHWSNMNGFGGLFWYWILLLQNPIRNALIRSKGTNLAYSTCYTNDLRERSTHLSQQVFSTCTTDMFLTS